MITRKSGKYLMVVLKDKTLFTSVNNYPQLVEFSRTFGAMMYIVMLQSSVEILSLEELANSVCGSFKSQTSDHEIIETLNPKKKRPTRTKSRSYAATIQKHIKRKLTTGKRAVALKDVKDKFKSYGLTPSCFSNHLRTVRRNLAKEGWDIKKIKAGRYEANKQKNKKAQGN